MALPVQINLYALLLHFRPLAERLVRCWAVKILQGSRTRLPVWCPRLQGERSGLSRFVEVGVHYAEGPLLVICGGV